MITEFIIYGKYILIGLNGCNSDLTGEEYTYCEYNPLDTTLKFKKDFTNTYLNKHEQCKTWKAYEIS